MSEETNDKDLKAEDAQRAGDRRSKSRQKEYDRLERITRGEITLTKPIMSRNAEVKVLHYDFSKLSNKDMVESLDCDMTVNGVAQITAKQADFLYARMHRIVEQPISGVDMTDIEQQASIVDRQTMRMVAKGFFTALCNVALLSIS